MPDEPSWDDLFSSQPESRDTRSTDSRATVQSTEPLTERRDERLVSRRPEPLPSRRESRRAAPADAPQWSEMRPERVQQPPTRPPRKKRRWVGWLVGLVSLALVLAIGAGAVYLAFGDQIRDMIAANEPIDYEGSGTGEVTITITAGDVGGDVAETLASAGVVKTYEAFYGLLLENPDVAFQPGSFAVKKEMSAQAALDALLDPANKRELTVLVQEGKSQPQALELLSAGAAIPLDQLTAAAADLASFGLPTEAPSLEGYLFPATYTFDPGIDAHGALQTMVNRTFEALDAAGVAPPDRHRVLTMAALIQREAGPVDDDFYKVSRVFANRLDAGWKLESDATVSYGTGRTDTVWTTPEERADASNRYNTYANPGLPVGPIGAAGDLAIDAALHPADGPWFFFVPINLDTGETVFSETLGQHEAAVAQLGQWCRSTDSPLCE